MKLEARTDRLQLTLQTTTLETHAVMTDHREAVQLALDRAAAWFKLEVDRLTAPPRTTPVLDAQGRITGQQLLEENASPLVYFGRTFNPDPLHEFRPEDRPTHLRRSTPGERAMGLGEHVRVYTDGGGLKP